MDTKDVAIIYRQLSSKEAFSVLDFINIISDTIVIKTNEYLAFIRDVVLEKLKSEIIDLLLMQLLNLNTERY